MKVEHIILKSELKKATSPLNKEQLCHKLGWTYNSTNDRNVRRMLAEIKQDIPIIALSCNKGYKVAKTSQEIETQIREHQSRINELKKHILYLKKHQMEMK